MRKQIKIYGERNTSTNYVSELVRLNLDADEMSGVVPRYINAMQKNLARNGANQGSLAAPRDIFLEK
jgi:hypothetical protein